MARPFLSFNSSFFSWVLSIIISTSMTDEQLLAAIHSAAVQYNQLLDQVFLFIGKNNNSPQYLWFQARFRKHQFMHLLGLTSPILSAVEFFDRAFDDRLIISDCLPSREHIRTTVVEKCSCCARILNLKDAKYMSIGSKDKITRNVEFSYAYGKEAILGFAIETDDIYFPITLIPSPIENFTTARYRTILICSKSQPEGLYRRPLIEIKTGLFDELFPSFPEPLAELFCNEKDPAE